VEEKDNGSKEMWGRGYKGKIHVKIFEKIYAGSETGSGYRSGTKIIREVRSRSVRIFNTAESKID
jgi:hypothetical protein